MMDVHQVNMENIYRLNNRGLDITCQYCIERLIVPL
jgi:hypothetical protein